MQYIYIKNFDCITTQDKVQRNLLLSLPLNYHFEFYVMKVFWHQCTRIHSTVKCCPQIQCKVMKRTGGSEAQNFSFVDNSPNIIPQSHFYFLIYWSTLVNILASYSNWENLGRKKSCFPYDSNQDIADTLLRSSEFYSKHLFLGQCWATLSIVHSLLWN